MSQAEMRSVLERIKVGLTQCRAGQANPDYTDTQAAQQRSASATVLREMMAALKNSDGQGRLLQAEILQTELIGNLNKYLPIKSFKISSDDQPWITPEIKELDRKKKLSASKKRYQ